MSSKFLMSAESSCALFSTAARCNFSDSRFSLGDIAGVAASVGCRGALEKSLPAALLFADDPPISRGADRSGVCGRKPPLLTGGAAETTDLAAGAAVAEPAGLGTEVGPRAS